MIFRAIKRLEFGQTVICPGALFPGEKLSEKSREILATRGAIARIAAPPLAELPGWKERAGALEAANVLDAEQFLEAEDETLTDILQVEPGQVAALKRELTGWLTIPEPKG